MTMNGGGRWLPPELRKPKPTHGFTRLGHAVHARTIDHLPSRTSVERFNKWLAIKVTNAIGSMWCAYAFCLLALCSLPAVLSAFAVFHGVFPPWLIKASVIALVAWVAQTFIQLVALSIIIVGQNIQATAADARAAKTFEDAEFIKDQVNEHTDGGIKSVIDAVNVERDTINRQLAALLEAVHFTPPPPDTPDPPE